MSNPNNCAGCDHKKYPDGGWCYMFRSEPDRVCLCHTAHRGMNAAEAIDLLASMRKRRELWQFRTTPESKTPNVGAKAQAPVLRRLSPLSD